MNDFFLELENVGKAFGRRRVFKGISGKACEGEVVIVEGPNGSGKSTLLKIICGLLQPTEGESRFFLNGRKVSRLDYRMIVGWVAPELAFYGELTAIENLRFLSRVRGRSLADEDLEELLKRVGLEERGWEEVDSYSTGMKARLKYAQAILHEPQVLVLDEPFSNLDAHGMDKVEKIIKSWKMRGIVVMAHPGKDARIHGNWTIDLAA